jgi:hypothetical protein
MSYNTSRCISSRDSNKADARVLVSALLAIQNADEWRKLELIDYVDSSRQCSEVSCNQGMAFFGYAKKVDGKMSLKENVLCELCYQCKQEHEQMEFMKCRLISDERLAALNLILGAYESSLEGKQLCSEEPTCMLVSTVIPDEFGKNLESYSVNREVFVEEYSRFDSTEVAKSSGFPKKLDTGAKVFDAAKKKYIKFNPILKDRKDKNSKWIEIVERIDMQFTSQLAHKLLREVTTLPERILAFLGSEGKYTTLHSDHMEAVNIAFRVNFSNEEVDSSDNILAYWYCAEPTEKAVRALSDLDFKNWKDDDYTLEKLDERFKTLQGLGIQITILKQKSAQIVRVPPGWIHCVVNTCGCLKLAWDYFVVLNLPTYFHSRSLLRSFRIKEDYAGLENLVVHLLDSLAMQVYTAYLKSLKKLES